MSYEFDRPASEVLRDTLSGGVNLPWNLALCAAIGLALMLPHVTLGVDGNIAHVHHVIGALAMTVVSLAAADVGQGSALIKCVVGLGIGCVALCD